MSETLTSIRCPNKRGHIIYDVCGRLLGAIDKGRIYLYCEICKQFFEIHIKDNNNVEMIPLSKNKRLAMKTRLRVLLND